MKYRITFSVNLNTYSEIEAKDEATAQEYIELEIYIYEFSYSN